MREIEIRILMDQNASLEDILERTQKSIILAYDLEYEGVEWEYQGTYVKVEFCSTKRKLLALNK